MKSIKATPFIDTMLNEEYRVFISQQFNINLFTDHVKGWRTYDEGTHAKYVNSHDKSTIEFFGNDAPYKITNPKLVGDKTFMFPFPKNLDQFICDCERCLVDLHWNESVTSKFDLKHLMKQADLPNYYEQLLIKLNKI